MLAKWGERNMLRVLFPALWTEDRGGSHLTADEQRIFYEQGIRPAVVETSPEDATDWPTTYRDELWRARNRKGGFALGTRPIASWNVWSFGQTLRRKLINGGIHWAADMVFFHQVRGVKSTSVHTMDGQAAQAAYAEFLQAVNLDIPEGETDWWIDVGLEFCAPGLCLQWRTDSHFHVVQDALDIRVGDAQRITTLGSGKYSIDFNSHLTGVAGCRVEPGSRAEGPFQARYLQMYTTDKSVVYHPEGRTYGKALTGKDVLNAKEDPAFCTGLYSAYVHARENIDSNARLEVRVPVSQAYSVLTRFGVRLMWDSLLGIPRNVWW
jgi:hypothetical protein